MRLQTLVITAIVDDGESIDVDVDCFLVQKDYVSFLNTKLVSDFDVGNATCEDDLSTAVAKED